MKLLKKDLMDNKSMSTQSFKMFPEYYYYWDKFEKEMDKLYSDKRRIIKRYLTYLFYKEFLAGARIELFDPSNVILITNLYTNSPKGCWMSVQEGLRDMQKDGILKIPLSNLSIVDGSFGNKTRDALLLLNSIATETEFERVLIHKLFKKSVLLAMKTYYTTLISGNPSVHLVNAKGWDNRIEELEHK